MSQVHIRESIPSHTWHHNVTRHNICRCSLGYTLYREYPSCWPHKLKVYKYCLLHTPHYTHWRHSNALYRIRGKDLHMSYHTLTGDLYKHWIIFDWLVVHVCYSTCCSSPVTHIENTILQTNCYSRRLYFMQIWWQSSSVQILFAIINKAYIQCLVCNEKYSRWYRSREQCEIFSYVTKSFFTVLKSSVRS
jgi:hypothetical protein